MIRNWPLSWVSLCLTTCEGFKKQIIPIPAHPENCAERPWSGRLVRREHISLSGSSSCFAFRLQEEDWEFRKLNPFFAALDTADWTHSRKSKSLIYIIAVTSEQGSVLNQGELSCKQEIFLSNTSRVVSFDFSENKDKYGKRLGDRCRLIWKAKPKFWTNLILSENGIRK